MAAFEADVLVVGLGPGGGAAAVAAAAAGLRVVAIDKKEHIGEPVQCAEFVPLPLSAHVGRDALVQPVRGMNTVLPSGAVQISQFPGLMVDRAAFDRAFAARADQNGATVLASVRLVSLDSRARRATITGRDGIHTVYYGALIAADGPHSTVASLLGLPPLTMVQTRQYAVPLTQSRSDTEIWLSDEFAGGYAWLFPKGALANLGLGTDRRFAPDLKGALERLRGRLVAQGVIGAEILARTGGAIPVGGLRSQLVHENVLFVGDAGGFTHPITGAGIAPAVLSGERAAEAAVAYLRGAARALIDYETDMRDQFEASLQRAVSRRRELDQRWCYRSTVNDEGWKRGWIAFEEYFEPEVCVK